MQRASTKWSVLLLGLVAGLAGCTNRVVVWETDGGSLDVALPDLRPSDLPPPLPPDRGQDASNPAAPNYIWAIDTSNRLLRFNPLTLKFKVIGKPNCASYGGIPHSMAVDRQGRAWVNYHSQNLNWVNTKTAACSNTGWPTNNQGYGIFGMGFAADTPGSSKETLYICARESTPNQWILAHINPKTLAITKGGKIPVVSDVTPEFTGTADGSLYGYFPGKTAGFVAKLNKATGALQKKWPVPALGGTVNSWAFAHWGGRFYLFVSVTGNSKVLRLDPVSGKVVTLLTKLPYYIVGAGVSVRAPLVYPDMGPDSGARDAGGH